jgi:transketolase
VPTPSRDLNALKCKALQIRKDILETLTLAASGHPGGSLSAVEILVSLYDCVLQHRPQEPKWPDRDRMIISKGHCTPVVYATLANSGYFPREELKTFRKYGTRLQGHVHVNCPGIEFNTGSLGHGLSVANGIAIGAKQLKKTISVYCLLGDGEIQEGSIWEAAMSASHFKLDNLCAIIDYNKVQENGPVNEIMNLEPLAKRWESFGWHTLEVDGHDFSQLLKAFTEFKQTKGKPTLIIAHTIKGKGVSFMEGNYRWHGKAPKPDELKIALAELEKSQN